MDNNVKKFAKGEVIFKEGAMETFMYDLIEGKVGIYASYGEADEKLLTELSAGDGGVTFGGKGGCVCVGPAGTMTMTGGTIVGGTAENGTVVDVLEGGTFTNNGGTIG